MSENTNEQSHHQSSSSQHKRLRLEPIELDDYVPKDRCPICREMVPIIGIVAHLRRCIIAYETSFNIPHTCPCIESSKQSQSPSSTQQQQQQYPFSNGSQYHMRPNKPVDEPVRLEKVPCIVGKTICTKPTNGMYNIMIHIGESYTYKICQVLHLKSDMTKQNIVNQLEPVCKVELEKEIYNTCDKVNCKSCTKDVVPSQLHPVFIMVTFVMQVALHHICTLSQKMHGKVK